MKTTNNTMPKSINSKKNGQRHTGAAQTGVNNVYQEQFQLDYINPLAIYLQYKGVSILSSTLLSFVSQEMARRAREGECKNAKKEYKRKHKVEAALLFELYQELVKLQGKEPVEELLRSFSAESPIVRMALNPRIRKKFKNYREDVNDLPSVSVLGVNVPKQLLGDVMLKMSIHYLVQCFIIDDAAEKKEMVIPECISLFHRDAVAAQLLFDALEWKVDGFKKENVANLRDNEHHQTKKQ